MKFCCQPSAPPATRGKLLGIGALAIFRVVLLGGIGLTIVSATGSLDVPVSVYATIATSFLWFVLGFAFFAALSAALASLVSRQEEVSGVMSPVTSLLLVSYLGSLYVANAPRRIILAAAVADSADLGDRHAGSDGQRPSVGG